MKRKLFGALVAVLLALVGTFVLVLYVQQAEDRALAGEEVVDVYVVEQAIDRGTPAEDISARVARERVPSKVVPGNAVSNLNVLAGRVAAVDLVPGEQVLSTRFVSPEELAAQAQIDVPPELHQVTVSLDVQRALGGNLVPGDTVGVLASFDPINPDEAGMDIADPEDPPGRTPYSTHLILHKVLVTNVQVPSGRGGSGAAPPVGGQGDDNGSTTGEAPGGPIFVTLAIDAPSVERVVFAAEHGRVWLSHEPEDAPEDGTQIQTRDLIYR